MLLKLPIVENNKKHNILFQIVKENDKYIVKPYLSDIYFYNILLSSVDDGIYVYPLMFPLEFNIVNNKLINELFFLLNIYKSNEYDFFYLLFEKIGIKYHSKIDDIYNYIYNTYNKKYQNVELINVNTLLHHIYYKVFFTINLLMYIYYNNKNTVKKFNNYINILKEIKINYNGIDDRIENHINNITKPIIKKNKYYYIHNNDKLLKVYINNSNYKNIIEKFKIYNYPPIKKHTKSDLFKFLMFNYKNYIDIFINKLLKKNVYYIKLFDYFLLGNDYLIYLNFIKFDNIENVYKKYCVDNIICNIDISFEYIKEIIDKDDKYNNNIVKDLYRQYLYPLNFYKNDLNTVLKKIIYYSIKFKNNYDDIIKNVKNNNLIVFLLNMYINKKFNDDYKKHTEYFNIINIIFINNIFDIKSIINKNIIEKFYNEQLIVNIITNLNWKNIVNKLDQINYYFVNYENTNILLNYINDVRIKKVLTKPIAFFKYLKHENDFIKWLYVIDSHINDLFNNTIIIKKNDYFKLGRILYLFSKMTNQNIGDNDYKNIVKYLSKHYYLVIYDNKINIRFKDIFKNKHINLGFLAKHIINNINYDLTFVNNDVVLYSTMDNDIDEMIIKYHKYKNKILEIENKVKTYLLLDKN